jgi:hypothetical protein
MLKRKERAAKARKMHEKRPEEDYRYRDTWKLLIEVSGCNKDVWKFLFGK